jgi:hypothetical protein
MFLAPVGSCPFGRAGAIISTAWSITALVSPVYADQLDYTVYEDGRAIARQRAPLTTLACRPFEHGSKMSSAERMG